MKDSWSSSDELVLLVFVTEEEILDEDVIRVCGDVGDVGWLCW